MQLRKPEERCNHLEKQPLRQPSKCIWVPVNVRIDNVEVTEKAIYWETKISCVFGWLWKTILGMYVERGNKYSEGSVLGWCPYCASWRMAGVLFFWFEREALVLSFVKMFWVKIGTGTEKGHYIDKTGSPFPLGQSSKRMYFLPHWNEGWEWMWLLPEN